MLEKIENKLKNNPFYKILDIDYFWYYTEFTDEELLKIVNFIYENTEEFKKKTISDINLNKAIKDIDSFYESIPNNTYEILQNVDGPERYMYKPYVLKKNLQSHKSAWLRQTLKKELGITASLVDDPKNKTFKIKYTRTPSKETLKKVEALRQTVLTDEAWQEMYKEQVKLGKQDKKKQEELQSLMNKYKEEKLSYRERCINKQAKIARWERVLNAIDIEVNLREYEKENNCHIRRQAIDSSSWDWENYKFNQDENGFINNAFILRKNIPYRLVDIKNHNSIGNMVSYPVAYLKPMCPDYYIYAYFSDDEKDPFVSTGKGYSKEELTYKVLLVEDMPIKNEKKVSRDFRDVYYVNDESSLEEIEEEKTEEDIIDEIQEDTGLSFDDIDLEEE